MSAGPTVSGYLDILVKSLLGGLLIAVLLTLARLRYYIVTGLLVSIPAVSLYTWWWIGREHGADSLRVSVRAAMWSAIPWVAYLAVVYLLAGRAPLWLALALGVLAWLIIAAIFALVLQPRP
ncbi:MAG: GlpM family protein [Armatimonadota bacterium]|nr:MAG: GlpM family protein [Armatimonadota bacterium]